MRYNKTTFFHLSITDVILLHYKTDIILERKIVVSTFCRYYLTINPPGF